MQHGLRIIGQQFAQEKLVSKQVRLEEGAISRHANLMGRELNPFYIKEMRKEGCERFSMQGNNITTFILFSK